MRIAQVSTLATAVGPGRSDSVESLVWLLTHELTALGHEVTVFAAEGSRAPVELVPTQAGPYYADGALSDWQLAEWVNLCAAIEQSERFDVIHSHAYLWGLPLSGLSRCPMVSTLHVTPYDDSARLRTLFPDSVVTAISAFQWSRFPTLPSAPVVHHGLDPRAFQVRATADDYVCFLGRFTPGKGPLEAIRVARELDLPIRLAGPPNDYYQEHIAPLVDGRNVDYVGYIGPEEKSELLGGARALVYPVASPEPFGLVLVEAMMCGTPVAGYDLGAVAEVVAPGVGGVVVDQHTDLAPALAAAMTLDRPTIAETARRRFDAARMAREYAEIYSRALLAAPVS